MILESEVIGVVMETNHAVSYDAAAASLVHLLAGDKQEPD
jgi:hypothetical protein